MWFRNYYVAIDAFVVCVNITNCFLMLSRLKINIILLMDRLRRRAYIYLSSIDIINKPPMPTFAGANKSRVARTCVCVCYTVGHVGPIPRIGYIYYYRRRMQMSLHHKYVPF